MKSRVEAWWLEADDAASSDDESGFDNASSLPDESFEQILFVNLDEIDRQDIAGLINEDIREKRPDLKEYLPYSCFEQLACNNTRFNNIFGTLNFIFRSNIHLTFFPARHRKSLAREYIKDQDSELAKHIANIYSKFQSTNL